MKHNHLLCFALVCFVLYCYYYTPTYYTPTTEGFGLSDITDIFKDDKDKDKDKDKGKDKGKDKDCPGEPYKSAGDVKLSDDKYKDSACFKNVKCSELIKSKSHLGVKINDIKGFPAITSSDDKTSDEGYQALFNCIKGSRKGSTAKPTYMLYARNDDYAHKLTMGLLGGCYKNKSKDIKMADNYATNKSNIMKCDESDDDDILKDVGNTFTCSDTVQAVSILTTAKDASLCGLKIEKSDLIR